MFLKKGFGFSKSAAPLKICSWNINGIRSLLKKQFQFDADIVCLSELRIDAETYEKKKIASKYLQGYKKFHDFSKKKKGYSGVGIYTKAQPLNVKVGMGIEKHDQEGRLITLQFEKFNIVNCYVPNAGQQLARHPYRINQWDIDFRAYLSTLIGKPTIVCGDFNVAHQEIDLTNPKQNINNPGFTAEERQNFTELLKSGWVDTFRILNPETVKYTFFNYFTNAREKNVGWRLDYFLVNSMEWVISSEIDDSILGSDHVPIFLSIDLNKL